MTCAIIKTDSSTTNHSVIHLSYKWWLVISYSVLNICSLLTKIKRVFSLFFKKKTRFFSIYKSNHEFFHSLLYIISCNRYREKSCSLIFGRRFSQPIYMLITGEVFCDTNDLDLDDTKNQLLEDVKKQLPDLDLDKAKAEAPSLEDVEKTLRDKCEKNGGEGAYDNFEVGINFGLSSVLCFLNFKQQLSV